jgi:hypothetical protein
MTTDDLLARYTNSFFSRMAIIRLNEGALVTAKDLREAKKKQ